MNFEKVEIVKGASDMGYTAITPVGSIDPNARIVVKERSLSMPNFPMPETTDIKILKIHNTLENNRS